MKHSLKYALIFAGLGAGLVSVPAMAHIFPKNFGTFDGTFAASAFANSGVSNNFGWIDGTDADWGDTHKLTTYTFTLTHGADVQLTFQEKANASGGLGIIPGFSLYQGLPHLLPANADHDFSPGSTIIRDIDSGGLFTEGAFKALTSFRITNDGDDLGLSPTNFTYIGHAYDGSADYGTGVIPGGDGVFDHTVTGLFHLAAGSYTAFVGGSDYASQSAASHAYGILGTIAVSPVPEPETYAMLLAGLGLMGAVARRRKQGAI